MRVALLAAPVLVLRLEGVDWRQHPPAEGDIEFIACDSDGEETSTYSG